MIAIDPTASAVQPSNSESPEKALRRRLDELLGSIHELTKRRDLGETTLQSSLPIELAMVVELGQVQDRLRLLGGHTYDGCRECRPFSWNQGLEEKEDAHAR